MDGEECGDIPMTTHRFPRKIGSRTQVIGTLGGETRPSTGYTFLRFKRYCRARREPERRRRRPRGGPPVALRTPRPDLFAPPAREAGEVRRDLRSHVRRNAARPACSFLDRGERPSTTPDSSGRSRNSPSCDWPPGRRSTVYAKASDRGPGGGCAPGRPGLGGVAFPDRLPAPDGRLGAGVRSRFTQGKRG